VNQLREESDVRSVEPKSLVRGQQYLPLHEQRCDVERGGWNLTVGHHLAVIVVAAVVQFAASAGLAAAVQATGHGPPVPADAAVFFGTGT